MKAGGLAWWSGKVRRFRGHLRADVTPAERKALADSLTKAQLGVFDAMITADQRHGLDVMATLRDEGISDPDVLLAGLLHDAGKGATGVIPRVIHALGVAYGPLVPSVARLAPGMSASLERLATHPERSAQLAIQAGCSERTADLIRWQEAPRDPEFGERLRLADDAN